MKNLGQFCVEINMPVFCDVTLTVIVQLPGVLMSVALGTVPPVSMTDVPPGTAVTDPPHWLSAASKLRI